jgi:Na+-transporting methylmalonyl-CoA/oxaloacetate decarboxylase gamma subunit
MFAMQTGHISFLFLLSLLACFLQIIGQTIERLDRQLPAE